MGFREKNSLSSWAEHPASGSRLQREAIDERSNRVHRIKTA